MGPRLAQRNARSFRNGAECLEVFAAAGELLLDSRTSPRGYDLCGEFALVMPGNRDDW